MNSTRVLVTGASIAGPALAHWLRRRGAEVTVVERAPELRPGGQAVDARGVAKEVIRRMGLDAAVRAARTETAGAYTVDVDGNVLETFRVDDHGGDGFIAEIEILRGDLSRVLHDDTRDGVEYVFGDRIAELTQDADGVDVVFAGGDRRRFDLVVRAVRRPAAHPGRHPGDGHVLLPRGRRRRRLPRRRGPQAPVARADGRSGLVDPAHPRPPGRHPGLLPGPGRPGGDGPLVERTDRAARRRGVQLVAAVRRRHRVGPGRRLPPGWRAGRGRVRPGGRVRRIRAADALVRRGRPGDRT